MSTVQSGTIQPSPPPPSGIPGYQQNFQTQMKLLNAASDSAVSGMSSGMNSGMTSGMTSGTNGMSSMCGMNCPGMNSDNGASVNSPDSSNAAGNGGSGSNTGGGNGGSGSSAAAGNGGSSSSAAAGDGGSNSSGDVFSEPDGVTYNTNMANVTSPLLQQIQQNAQNGIQPTEAQATQAVAQEVAGMEDELLNKNTPNNVKNALTTEMGHISEMENFGMSSISDLEHLSNLNQQANNSLANGGTPQFIFPKYSPANVSAALTDLGNGNTANANAAVLAQNAGG